MHNDIRFEMLDVVVDVQIVFIYGTNSIAGLPSFGWISFSLGLFCFETIKFDSFLLQCISQMILLPLKREKLSFLEFNLDKSFVDFFFDGLGHRESFKRFPWRLHE